MHKRCRGGDVESRPPVPLARECTVRASKTVSRGEAGRRRTRGERCGEPRPFTRRNAAALAGGARGARGTTDRAQGRERAVERGNRAERTKNKTTKKKKNELPLFGRQSGSEGGRGFGGAGRGRGPTPALDVAFACLFVRTIARARARAWYAIRHPQPSVHEPRCNLAVGVTDDHELRRLDDLFLFIIIFFNSTPGSTVH